MKLAVVGQDHLQSLRWLILWSHHFIFKMIKVMKIRHPSIHINLSLLAFSCDAARRLRPSDPLWSDQASINVWTWFLVFSNDVISEDLSHDFSELQHSSSTSVVLLLVACSLLDWLRRDCYSCREDRWWQMNTNMVEACPTSSAPTRGRLWWAPITTGISIFLRVMHLFQLTVVMALCILP